MADYSVTPGNVVPTAALKTTLIAGEAIDAGELIYKKASDSKAYLAQIDGTEEEADAIGIAVVSAGTGQPVVYQTSGPLAMGSVFTAAGAVVMASRTAGKLAPIADLSTSDFLTLVGWSTSATTLNISLQKTGVETAAS